MSHCDQSILSPLDRERLANVLLDAAPTALYVFDLAGHFPVYVSSRGSEVLGLGPGAIEAAGSDFLPRTMHPDDLPRAAMHFAGFANAADGETRVFEYRMRAAGGTWHWFRSHDVVFTRDPDGRPRQLLGLGLDVTAHRAAEARLAAANERFAWAEAAANAFSYEWDLATGHVERSTGLRGVLGYAPEDLAPTWEAWSALKHPDDRQLTKAEAIAFLTTVSDETLGTEYRVRHQDGTYRWLSERATLVRDTAGRLQRLIGQTVDVTERKAMEEALRDRERFASGVANATPGLLYVYDLTTHRNLYVNDQLERLFGWTREDLDALGQGFLFQLIHPQDLPVVASRAERLSDAADGEVIEVDYRLRRKDGTYRWLRSRDTVFARDAAGKVIQVLGMAEDVTERKQAEEALRRSEAIYRRLAEANLFGVGFGTSTGEVTFVNDEMLRMMGRTRAEFEAGSINWAAALAPEFREALAIEAQRVLTEGSSSGYEAAFLRPDGGRTPYVAAAALVEPGEDYHVSIALDLTTIRAAEAALRESEARFRTMADETPLIIWATDATGGNEFVNRAYTQFFGLTEEDVRGPNWHPLVHPDDVEAYVDALHASLHAGTPFRAVARVRRSDGIWRWIESFGAPRVAADGTVVGMVGSSLDITERKQAEADRVAFLDALAHDVKNPLGAAKGRAQLIRRQIDRGQTDPAKLAASLASIDVTLNEATNLINEMLDVAHLREGRALQLQLAPTDLAVLAQSYAEEAQHRSPRHHVQVVTEGSPPVGVWDAERLGRVLRNVLENAVKYSPDGGEILVHVARVEDAAGTWAEVAVTDQGVGIPAGDLAKVFEQFHRGSNVAGIAGTGIGLAGSKQIIEQHRGTITVASVEGHGSTFTMRLPL